jgi:B-cell receptor-associated protein 31
MYLCGFTLFLSLILNRTYVMVCLIRLSSVSIPKLTLLLFQILETLKLETKLKQYEGDAKAQGKDGAKLNEAGGASEIGNLKKKLEQKDRDLENLKKQAEGLNKEYRELSDKYAATQPSGGPKKDR